MKALILTPQQWRAVVSEINKNHPKSVTMVRWKMKEVLGFTTREHHEWPKDMVSLRPTTMIHLDFYDEAKRTMFLLKYGDVMQDHL